MTKYKQYKEYTVEIEDNYIKWYNKEGDLHRDEGPACEHLSDSTFKAWYKNGKLHRDDGPALIDNGNEKFFLYGKEYTKVQFDDMVRMDDFESKIIKINGQNYKLLLVDEQNINYHEDDFNRRGDNMYCGYQCCGNCNHASLKHSLNGLIIEIKNKKYVLHLA